MSEEGWRLCCRQPLYHGWLPRPLYLPEGPGPPRKPRTEQDPSPPTRTRPTLLPLLPASLRPGTDTLRCTAPACSPPPPLHPHSAIKWRLPPYLSMDRCMLNCWDAPHQATLRGDCVKPHPLSFVVLVAFLVVPGGIVVVRVCGCDILFNPRCCRLVYSLFLCCCSLPGGNVFFPHLSVSL